MQLKQKKEMFFFQKPINIGTLIEGKYVDIF